MRYSKYTIFLKVVELESFSKTADFYKYSQSAVTQIVKSLEAELQMTLLKRSHAGVCLTSDGEQLIPHILLLKNTRIKDFPFFLQTAGISSPLPKHSSHSLQRSQSPGAALVSDFLLRYDNRIFSSPVPTVSRFPARFPP